MGNYPWEGDSILRDPRSGRFVCYGRLRFPDAFPQFEIGRAVARVQSDNLHLTTKYTMWFENCPKLLLRHHHPGQPAAGGQAPSETNE